MLIKGSKIQIGEWKDGKKLEWLSEEKIKEMDIEREQLLKRNHPKDKNRINELTFDKPANFEQIASDIKVRIAKILLQ